MALLGFHASHELYSPAALLEHVQHAQQAGFTAAMCSDHFHPWTPQQGQSAFSFAWLGAALQATDLSMGTICCPVGRYHPAVVAQAAATLAVMFPDRFWLALGTGQALNEHITSATWLPKHERQHAVATAAEAIRSLWAGREVTSVGPPPIDRARIYTRPTTPPLLFGAATTPETAAWVATWADGLLTVASDFKQLQSVVTSFRKNGGAGKPMYLQSMVGYDADEQHAWQQARDNWPVAALTQDELQSIETPEEFNEKTKHVTIDDLRDKLRVSSDLSQHRQWLADDLRLGFDAVYVFTITGNPATFIDAYGAHVLPHFR